jgi:hypothetical protein
LFHYDGIVINSAIEIKDFRTRKNRKLLENGENLIFFDRIKHDYFSAVEICHFQLKNARGEKKMKMKHEQNLVLAEHFSNVSKPEWQKRLMTGNLNSDDVTGSILYSGLLDFF